MAKMKLEMPDELMRKLSRLGGKTDAICEKALKEGAEVVKMAVASSLDSAIGHGTKYESRSTGQLRSALGISPVKQGKNGELDIKIGLVENRNDGKSNAMIANVLEYGKPGQSPTGFLKKAKNKSKKTATNRMSAYEYSFRTE